MTPREAYEQHQRTCPVRQEAKAATTERIVSTLRCLVEDGGDDNFVIFIADETRNYFVQFATSCGSAVLYGEAVSNRFLKPPFRLSATQKATLIRLGWSPPQRGNPPNFHRYWQVVNDRDRQEITAVAIATFESVYGWRSDQPLWVELYLDGEPAEGILASDPLAATEDGPPPTGDERVHSFSHLCKKARFLLPDNFSARNLMHFWTDPLPRPGHQQ